MAEMVLLSSHVMAHELRIARFDIKSSERGYDLTIQMDRENILRALKNGCSESSITNTHDLNAMIYAYIWDNFSMVIDGKSVDYKLLDIEFDDYFVVVNGYFTTAQQPFRKMEVQNTCLIETLEKHNNIVRIIDRGQSRSFRLHEDRQSTVIEY